MEKQTEWTRSTARSAYEAYIKNSGGLAYNGAPCPPWDKLGVLVQSHWCAAVLDARGNVQLESERTLQDVFANLEARDAELLAKSRDIETLNAKLKEGSADESHFDRASKAEGELRECRQQLSNAHAQIKERDQKLKALSVVGDQRAQKYAADRTAMLDLEVDKLRGQLAEAEQTIRVLKQRA